MARNRSSDNGRKRRALAGIRDLRSAIKARLRSKPQVEGQEYLDMYALSRDRARWVRMAKQSVAAIEAIEDDLARIQETLPASERTQAEDSTPPPAREHPKRTVGAFKLEY